MASDKSTIERLLTAIAEALATLEAGVTQTDTIEDLMMNLGWRIEPLDESQVNAFRSMFEALDTVPDLLDALQELLDASEKEAVLAAMVRLGAAIGQTMVEIEKVATADWTVLPPPFDSQEFSDFLPEVPLRLLELLLVNKVFRRDRRVYAVLRLIGVINEEHYVPPSSSQYRIEHDRILIDWSLFETLFSEPSDLLLHTYGWGAPAGQFDSKRLISNVGDVLAAFGFPARITGAGPLGPIYYGDETAYSPQPLQLCVPLFSGLDPLGVGYVEVGVNVLPIPNNPGGAIEGILVYPYATTEADLQFNLSEGLRLLIEASFESGVLIGVEFFPGRVVPVLPGQRGALPSGKIRIALDVVPPSPLPVLTIPGGIGLFIGDIEIAVLASTEGTVQKFELDFDIRNGKLALSSSDGDGFLQKLLPETMEFGFDVGVTWSSLDGIRFHGSAGLEVTLPIHESLGPITIESVYLAIKVQDDGTIAIAVAASAGAAIGPVAASIERIGLKTAISFPGSGGNLGPLNIEPPEFLPPTGVGLAVDAGILFGGGFLKIDTENERYSGILALNLGEYAVTAIGLITTKMPDGSKNFSMLINIGIVFDPPINLPYNLTLSGVGGIVGINRAMDIEELQKRFRNGTVEDILFPDLKTAITKADTIIENMRAVFPTAYDKFIIGPMVKIGYGSPNVIQADIGIFMVLPDLNKFSIMGKLTAIFPTPEEETVRINVQLMGNLTLEKKEITFQSSIYDSEILKIALWGDIAALLRWSDPPEFTMAMGGFHPKFTPPPPARIFGGLRRLSLVVTWGNEIFLMCQSYIALTPNSLQFGASIQLIVNVEAFSANGSFSFDALFYFNPFSFEITADVNVNIQIAGVSLVDADIDLKLSGPTPWHARGSARVSLLFIDTDTEFDITWGQQGAPSTPAIDPLGNLVRALKDNSNWSAHLPHTRSMVETLHPMEADGTGALVVHPAGSLEVRQNVLPLGMQLEKFGNSPITGHDQFEIKSISIGAINETPGHKVKEYINRGAYEKLTKNERLSKPSFEKMDVGIRFSSDPIVFGGNENVPASGTLNRVLALHDYESVYLNPEEISKPGNSPGFLDTADAMLLIAGSAASNSKQLTGGDRKFVTANLQPRIQSVNELSYAIANLDDFTRATDLDKLTGDDRSLWHVEQVLETHIKKNQDDSDRYIIVAEYEL